MAIEPREGGLEPAAREADERLAEVSDAFDLLLDLTPTNADEAFAEFERGGGARAPCFTYRDRETEPALLREQLAALDLDSVEEATLSELFRQKRDELELRIETLLARGTPAALECTRKLYGDVEDALFTLAQDILERFPEEENLKGRPVLDAAGFARLAEAELDHYRSIDPGLQSTVAVRDDVTGLMVSNGNLLVGRSVKIPVARVQALLQHEIGTHVLTWCNGLASPLKLLHCGLARYEELQEGLAVLSEYLSSGLDSGRLRLLAARVVAVRLLIEGAEFIETFRALAGGHGFERMTAFTVTMRVYRGGGLTKDAIYLRGLARLREHLSAGGRLEPLFAGKIGTEHVSVIQDLLQRGVLQSPRLRPRWLENPDAVRRLEQVRSASSVLDLAGG